MTSVRLVLTPESVVVAEARRTFTALSLYGYALDLVIANRVFPAGDDEWRQGWAKAQQAQLVGIRESFAGLPVRELPYRAGEPVGAGALREVADALYGELPGHDPAPVGTPRELLIIDTIGDEFVLRMPLPLASKSAVDLARAGDDLVLTVGGNRRVLTLPSVLRRCVVVGGGLRRRRASGALRARSGVVARRRSNQRRRRRRERPSDPPTARTQRGRHA